MIRNKDRRRYNNQIGDEDILQDGETMRVPMQMMDAAASPPRRSRSNPTQVTDGTGDPLALHRPGPRIASGGNEVVQLMREARRDWRDAAYATYERELRSAWRGPDGSNRGKDTGPAEDADETANRFTSEYQKTDQGGIGAAASRHVKQMNELYDQRDRELRDEWRKG